jgi:hypothetical protein
VSLRVAPESELQHALLVEARQISVALPALDPMLSRRKEAAFKRLMGNYRDGKHNDQQAIIAELFVIETIVNELNSKLQNLKFEKKG